MNQENNPDCASAPLVGIAYDRAMDSIQEQPHIHERAQLLYCQAGCYQAGSVSKLVHRPTTFQINS